MPEYKCELCIFSTHLKSNYTSHLNSKKHITISKLNEAKTLDNIKQHRDNSETTCVAEKVSTEFMCKYCDQKFSFRQSMNRHIKYTCAKNKDEDLKKLIQKMVNRP